MATQPTLDVSTISIRLGATLFFVLLNGFFVAAEFALVKVRRSRVEALAGAGNAGARIRNGDATTPPQVSPDELNS